MKILDHRKAKGFALWVKGNTKAINVLATVFLGLTFISGLAWMLGAQIEPIAFVLGLCSSSFFGLPHLAEFILPTRKAVANMTHDELLKLVLESDPKKDWKGLSNNNWSSEVFLREDPRLRFRVKYIDEGIQNDDYQDEWANRHPDAKATGYWYDLSYDGNLIARFILVSVDGGRAKVPPPDWQTGRIRRIDYRVAQIHDVVGTLDEYILRSGLKVEDESA